MERWLKGGRDGEMVEGREGEKEIWLKGGKEGERAMATHVKPSVCYRKGMMCIL